MVMRQSVRWLRGSDNRLVQRTAHAECSKRAWVEMTIAEKSGEAKITCSLREILTSFIVNQLRILWMRSRDPVAWLVKGFILFILLVDFHVMKSSYHGISLNSCQNI